MFLFARFLNHFCLKTKAQHRNLKTMKSICTDLCRPLKDWTGLALKGGKSLGTLESYQNSSACMLKFLLTNAMHIWYECSSSIACTCQILFYIPLISGRSSPAFQLKVDEVRMELMQTRELWLSDLKYLFLLWNVVLIKWQTDYHNKMRQC